MKRDPKAPGNAQAASGFVMLALCLALANSCRNGPPAPDDTEQFLTREAGDGLVKVVMSVTPSEVLYHRDNLLTITVTAPPEVKAVIPPLDDRLQGFVLNGIFADEPVVRDDTVTRTHHARITPIMADRHRIAPIPVTYTDHSVAPASFAWFPTPPVEMYYKSPAPGEIPSDIDHGLEPVWISPPLSTVAFAAACILVAAGLLVGVVIFAKRLRRRILIARLSPRERALRELEELLAQDLIRAGRVKDFYVELTMVVRRYIERAHAIRAPEQTTEEFLAAVVDDSRFVPEIVQSLKDFLQAADLVKFAAHRPDDNTVEGAVRTARAYVETDDARGEENNTAERE